MHAFSLGAPQSLPNAGFLGGRQSPRGQSPQQLVWLLQLLPVCNSMTLSEPQSLSWLLPLAQTLSLGLLLLLILVCGTARSPGAGPTGNCPLSPRQDGPWPLSPHSAKAAPHWSHEEPLPLGSLGQDSVWGQVPLSACGGLGPTAPFSSALL